LAEHTVGGGPGEKKGAHGSHDSPDAHSDEKLKRMGSSDTQAKGGKKAKGSDQPTKGKVSDDKDSRSSQSLDSDNHGGKVIK